MNKSDNNDVDDENEVLKERCIIINGDGGVAD